MNNDLYALDVETALLGAVFLNPDCLSSIADFISQDDFYSKENGKIFEAMMSLRQKDEPIDDKFIIKELGANLNQVALNNALANSGVIDVEKYAKLIRELSQKRQILALAQQSQKIVNEKSVNDALDEISSRLYKISSSQSNKGLKSALEAAKLAAQEILRRKEQGSGLVGLDTGFSDINYKTNGLKNGDLIVIAARPGMGKTTFALNLVENVLRNGVGAVFFSLEMPAEQLMFRMFSSLASVELDKIYKGVSLSDSDLEGISMVCERVSDFEFYIYDAQGDSSADASGVTIHKIRSELRKLKEKNPNIGLCVVDYIGLMANSSKFNERHLQIAEISRSLKLLAREMQMPIIALSQLNRGLESRANKKPMLSDLRESGAIEQDADIIMFVYREDVYKEQEAKERAAAAEAEGKSADGYSTFKAGDIEKAKIIIGKNRNGATGEVDLMFDKKYSRFVNILKEPIAEIYEASDD